MKTFTNKTAVVTGAASGIGRALALRCAAEGLRVVLADVEDEALQATEEAVRAAGAETLAVRTDVSQAAEVERLAERAFDAFGGVHLLVNNAGVGAGGSVWESTQADWEWVLGVNLWGVIHGVRAFLPRMLEQDAPGHVVNTASVAGLIPYMPMAPYLVSKHAVVALSEHMYYTLRQREARVGVSVLCPGWVKTRILEAHRNRPDALRNEARAAAPDPQAAAARLIFEAALETGIPPGEVADAVFAAVREGRFYVLTHPEYEPVVRARADALFGAGVPPFLPGGFQ